MKQLLFRMQFLLTANLGAATGDKHNQMKSCFWIRLFHEAYLRQFNK